jgi:putative ABC transport system ATP-binding protein/macrolide transport system ATP-binding/permease protein/lipoprotein-releasing system ATP-binding protein
MRILAHGVRKTYATERGRIAAVDGVDVEVRPREFLVICGRSGSGKSTLLGLLAGLCKPTEGVVTVDGRALATMTQGELSDFRARNFGFLFQFTGLLPNLRSVDNVALPALLLGGAPDAALERARLLLERVGLGERWDSYPGEMSGGQLRRVALARALVNDPRVLFADEPTNDLDTDAEHEMLSLLESLRDRDGVSLVVVTHAPEVAARAGRLLTMRSGKITSESERIAGEAVPLRPAPARSAELSPFEPPPAALAPAAVTAAGAGLRRFVVDFLLVAVVVAIAMVLVNGLTARQQRRALDAKVTKRRAAEELALQQLRADIEDLKMLADGSYELWVYLENFSPQKPLFVLGPSLRVFVQIDRVWQQVATSSPHESTTLETSVHEVASDKLLVAVRFRLSPERFDELLKGYMHVRINNTMVVADHADHADHLGDVFERTDDYYVYLRPSALSEEEARRRNGWAEGAVVPRWIPMPAH